MKWRDVIIRLREAGFEVKRKGKTAHQQWHHSPSGESFTVLTKHRNHEAPKHVWTKALETIRRAKEHEEATE